MSCYNHPNAPTAATCQRCQVEMCGMCARFLESGEYCEKCAAVVQAEEYVEAKAEKLNKPEPEPIATEQPEEQLDPALRRKDQDKGIIWLGIGGSSLMIFVSLLMYAFPNIFEFDAEAEAARMAAQALEDCRLVFEEISYVLEDGELPDDSMRCAESNVPNIVSRSGNSVRVSHPNPAAYGLSEIYVTNENHEVILVNGEQS